MVDDRRILTFSAVLLFSLWIASTIPLLAVLIEFPTPACDSTRVGWFFARYWGSLFIYPAFLSGFALLAIYIPLTTVTRYVLNNRAQLFTCLGFLLCMTTLICFVEFSDSPLAPFEVPSSRLSTSPLWQDIMHMCNHDLRINFTDYQKNISDLVRDERSFTGKTYYFGVVVQSISQIMIFICLAIFVRAGDSGIYKAAIVLPKANLFILGCAIFFGSIWCLFRMAYRADENSIFAFDGGRLLSGYSGDYIIVLIYTILFATYLMLSGSQLKAIEGRLSQLGTLVVYVCGIGAIKIADPTFVTSFIGSRSTVGNVLFLVVGCALVSFLSMMFAMRDPGINEPMATD
jgi:hypothetical protein